MRPADGARLVAIALRALLVAVILSFVAVLPPERPISRVVADNRCASTADGARDSDDPDCLSLLPDGLNIVHEFEERQPLVSP